MTTVFELHNKHNQILWDGYDLQSILDDIQSGVQDNLVLPRDIEAIDSIWIRTDEAVNTQLSPELFKAFKSAAMNIFCAFDDYGTRNWNESEEIRRGW